MNGAAAAERARAFTATAIAEALGGRRSGTGWTARCPAHEDATPSLSIGENRGRVLVRCHAGCTQAEVITALRERRLWPEGSVREQVPTRSPDHVWEYADAGGNVVRRTARWNTTSGKIVRPQRPNDRGGWQSGEMDGPRPLYRLAAALARLEAPVLVTEGEPAADAAARMLPDHVAVTSAGGAQAAARTDWSPLGGRSVVIWPDHDAAGAQYAADVVRLATEAGAAEVRMVTVPPDAPPSWDLADTMPEGWTVETLRALLASAASAAEQSDKPRALDLAEFLAAEFAPRENMMDPVFPRQGLGMVHAWRGLGKTYFTTSFALSIAAAAAFLKWSVHRPWNVLYVDGEMRGVDMQERLAKLVKGITPRPESSAFRIITPDLQENGIPDLGTRDGQRWLDCELDDRDLVILDNLSSLVRSGTDKEDDLWLPLLDWLLRLRASGRSALLVHHDGKNEQQRGTSRREDQLDTVFHLKKPTNYKPTDGARFVLHFEKHRGFYGKDCEPFEVALVEDESGVLSWTSKDIEDATLQVAELLKDGCTVSQIASELKIGRATVQRHKLKAIQRGLCNVE